MIRDPASAARAATPPGQSFSHIRRVACILSFLLLLVGCGQKETAMNDTIIKSAEEAIKHLESHPPSGPSFQLAISESLTFAGKPDRMGAGMAIILDKVLGLGYQPDGFEQKSGFRLYRYKKMQ